MATAQEKAISAEYNFIIKGEKAEYETKVVITAPKISVSCSCGSCHKHALCWHAKYLLAGRTSRLLGDPGRIEEMIEKLSEIPEGKAMVRISRRKYAYDNHCRRCNSTNIVKIQNSFLARLLTLFKNTEGHFYYCWNCKWTW